MESDDREDLERDIRRVRESIQNKLAAARKECNLSDEQFEQLKQDIEFGTVMAEEQAKQIHDLLESEESATRLAGLLHLFAYIQEREAAVSEKFVGVHKRIDLLIEDRLFPLAVEVASLRAEVEALKKRLPAEVESKQALPTSANQHKNDMLTRHVKEMLSEQPFPLIKAIKRVQSETGWGLKKSKDFVDRIRLGSGFAQKTGVDSLRGIH